MADEEATQRVFAAVREVINQWDPVGLHPGAFAPEDEYDPEVRDIAMFVTDAPRDVATLATRVFEVFTTWFGEDMAYCFPLEDCKVVAAKLIAALDR